MHCVCAQKCSYACAYGAVNAAMQLKVSLRQKAEVNPLQSIYTCAVCFLCGFVVLSICAEQQQQKNYSG